MDADPEPIPEHTPPVYPFAEAPPAGTGQEAGTDAGSGDDKCGDSGDIERAAAVASGAAGIEQGLAGEGDIDGVGFGAHGSGEAEEFVAGFAFHTEGDEEGGDLTGGGLAFEDGSHGLGGVLGSEAFTVGNAVQVGDKRHVIVKVSTFEILTQAQTR